MRIAVFTSQFPGRVSTFFARDMRVLLQAGFTVDIFPIYPRDDTMWQYVPDILNEHVLPRKQVHHLSLGSSLWHSGRRLLGDPAQVAADAAQVLGSAARFGRDPLTKSAYVLPKGLAWAKYYPKTYDHVLSYWGNYAATCAYMFHRYSNPRVPFSMFLHAGTDLYRQQVFLRQKLCYADNIFVVCAFNREFIRRLYPDIFEQIDPHIHIYHLGLDLADLEYRPHGRPPNVCLGVGRLAPLKGYDYLLRAAAELRQRGIDIQVELVGDGDAAADLRALAAELQITDRVRFLGWLPFNEVRAAMNRATMLVHPSTGLGDAVPTVIKEAMALGLPVVASQVAGIPELLDNGNCGMLVPPQDVDALANAITAMLHSEERRLHYARVGRAFAEHTFDLWRNGHWLTERLRATQRIACLQGGQDGQTG
jgi:glycosyltransferase involved in cell wall biosynthesis